MCYNIILLKFTIKWRNYEKNINNNASNSFFVFIIRNERKKEGIEKPEEIAGIEFETENLQVYETGTASFYGGKWHGRKTANGEIFNTNSLTAAHKTLPFNTRVKVTNLSNGKSVIVRINNRGPYIKGRIIDLSTAAFTSIESRNKGITRVKLEIVK